MDRPMFLEQLRQSRLLSEEQLLGIAARFGEEVPAQEVASVLVAEGLLTRYQAQRIWNGKTRGLVLGQYRILDELGEGGFGQVFKALHALMDRQVAIKIIAPELVEDSRARTWFRREVLAYTELSHPNIVMAYDANEVDDVLFFVMEYVDGLNLDAFVKEQGPLPIDLTCEMMRQAALALQHAHEKGMVHRDIKPANLLIPRGVEVLPPTTDAGGNPLLPATPPVLVKVVDFGLARLHRTAKAGTVMLQSERSFLGTPDYVSPEQARSVHSVDIRSDLYSLGCTFYYALTAKRPFYGKTVLEVIVQHLEQDPEPLEDHRPDVPEEVRAIVQRLMAKDPAERFQTPAELVAALAPWCVLSGGSRPAGVAAARTPGIAANTARIPALATPVGATALVPQLAFWDGPVLNGVEAATAPGPTRVTPVPAASPEEDTTDDHQPDARARDTSPTRERGIPATCPTRRRRSDATLPLPGLARCSPGVETLESPRRETEGTSEATSRPTPSDTPPASFCPTPEFRRCWRAWVGVVEAFVQGGRIQVDEQGYRAVHGTLLAACRATTAGPKPALLVQLESVLEPWLTPHTLAGTDRQTLASLLQQCRRLDQELGAQESISLRPWLGLLVVLGVAAAVGWYLNRTYDWMPILETAIDQVRTFVEARPLVCLAVTVPAILAGTLYGLSRLLRA